MHNAYVEPNVLYIANMVLQLVSKAENVLVFTMPKLQFSADSWTHTITGRTCKLKDVYGGSL